MSGKTIATLLSQEAAQRLVEGYDNGTPSDVLIGAGYLIGGSMTAAAGAILRLLGDREGIQEIIAEARERANAV